MTFLSVVIFGMPAVVSISAGISPWFRFSRSLYPNTIFSRKRLEAELISVSFIIHEPTDSKDQKFFNNSQ